jgi:predicted Zn-dependent peptidase
MSIKKLLMSAVAIIALLSYVSCSKYKYETVKGDPMNTKIYTLDNGLKIYMTVNKETPRLQTYIAVRVGSKNDPHETTGLSHYLEHLMFKGTENFGTSDYAAEKPKLDSIKALFEVYRTKTDPEERKAIYHQIDSISYASSKIAIANEYDKLMSIIGAQGTNAFTSNDMTVYQEDIPSNQIENWAKIEADRFMHPVIRGFHTELEAVYEEKNMSLTEDMSKCLEAIDSVLFKNHPYGQQTTLGTQEHLKNPSIINIENHRNNFYVPNNIAICVSGDFDPDTFVATIEKYFGDWKPNPDIKMLDVKPEDPITTPVHKDVYGNDAEFVLMGWRVPGAGAKDFQKSEIGDLVGSILYNGKAGLFDLDIIQAQKINSVAAFNYSLPDEGQFLLIGYPREGQTLEEVRNIMLEEVAKLRNGDFSDTLIQATINNYKLNEMRRLESNDSRAMMYVNAFIYGHDWKDDVEQLSRMEKITKQQIVDWANEYLGENSYVEAFKHIGEDKSIEKIEAPAITPIEMNRSKQSDFLKSIQADTVKPIEPVFVDYAKDMTKKTFDKNIDLLYKKNDINDIAQVIMYYDEGSQNDPYLQLASDYLSYLGTPTRSAEQINKELYSLACNFYLSIGNATSTIGVSGLDENVGKALDLLEDRIFNAVPDEAILERLKSDMFKSRADSKLNQSACFSNMWRYIEYGAEYVHKNTLTNEQVKAITSDDLLGAVRDLYSKQHKIIYYGPSDIAKAESMIKEHHKIAENPAPLVKHYPQPVKVDESKVFIVPYDANQFYYVQYSNRGEQFNAANDAIDRLYNNYFGNGMNGIVFQEMREARGLAYASQASFVEPYSKDIPYIFFAFIASQNDKLKAAVEGFDNIINNMPESQEAFNVAKTSMINDLRTARTTGIDVIYSYLDLEDLGLSEDRNKAIFEQVQNLTLDDVKAFQQKWIKDRKYIYGFLGDQKGFDMDFLNTLGPVQTLTLEEVFGY